MTVEQTNIFYILLIFTAYLLIWLSSVKQIGRIRVRINWRLSLSIISLFLIIASYFLLLIPLINRQCGVDTPQYYRTYASGNTSGLDFTFYFICKVLHDIIPNPKIGLGILSALTLLMVYYAFLRIRNVIDYKYAFMAYYSCIYFYLYNYMRIMIAVAFIFLGYSFIVSGRGKKPYLLFGIAILFHRSALVVLFVFLVSRFFNKYRTLMISIGMVLLGVFIAFPSLFFRLVTIERYSEQITSVNQTVGIGTTLVILPFVVLLYMYNSKVSDRYLFNTTLYFVFANFAFAFLGYYVPSASRLSNMYFLFHLVFFTPYLIKNIENSRDKRVILIAFFIMYCVLKYYLGANNFSTMGIVPYY